MGHLNPPMLLGTLATIEAGLRARSAVARARGGADRRAARAVSRRRHADALAAGAPLRLIEPCR